MKIAYIATSAIPSSTANSIQVMKVCQAFCQNGHTVTLFVPGSGVVDWKELKTRYGLTVEFNIARIPSINHFKRFDFIFRALQDCLAQKVDLVYTRMLWVAYFAQKLRLPVILELHDLPGGRFGKSLLKRFIQSRSRKKIVSITHALVARIESRFNMTLPHQDLIIAPDGVDLERYQSLPEITSARKKLGLPEKLTAVYTGGFYRGRGLELLLNLAIHFPQVHFIWVGGKPEAVADWSDQIKVAGINNIQLTGFIDNQILPLYQTATDILLMPFGKTVAGSSGGNTADVCSPMKMFEYMAAGRAILTSDLPVLREVLNDQNAIFYEPENFSDLKRKFSELIENPALRERIAAQARLDVEKYSWQRRMRLILESFA
jgi:glycosyltransferase involved in cell wall biosynthesis